MAREGCPKPGGPAPGPQFRVGNKNQRRGPPGRGPRPHMLPPSGPQMGSQKPARTVYFADVVVHQQAPRLSSQAFVLGNGVTVYDDGGASSGHQKPHPPWRGRHEANEGRGNEPGRHGGGGARGGAALGPIGGVKKHTSREHAHVSQHQRKNHEAQNKQQRHKSLNRRKSHKAQNKQQRDKSQKSGTGQQAKAGAPTPDVPQGGKLYRWPEGEGKGPGSRGSQACHAQHAEGLGVSETSRMQKISV
eukprot:jgi/Botrbrau1/12631/Bobra.0169s0156.1